MIKWVLLYLGLKFGIKKVIKDYVIPKSINAKIKKYSDSDQIEILDAPNELFETSSITKINNEYLESIIDVEKFEATMKTFFREEDLANFYRNLSSIKEMKSGMFNVVKFAKYLISGGANVAGDYSAYSNTMKTNNSFLSKLMGATTHELLHASSTRYDKEQGVIYTGFQQIKVNNFEHHGIALDEGFTQLLNEKYFVAPDYSSPFSKEFQEALLATSYTDEKKIVTLLADSIGLEKMKSLYLNGNLMGLVEELSKYSNVEDVLKFIAYTDALMSHNNKKKKPYEETKDAINFVLDFLTNVYVKSYVEKDENVSDKNISDAYFCCRRNLRDNLPYGDSYVNENLVFSILMDSIKSKNNGGITKSA
ncbi:MAG: hypothetical protein J6A52_07465 [Bacilli bacterium]|nr:hypothetical protein [Bacilli bacterium]